MSLSILPAQHIAKLEQLISEKQTGLLTMSFGGKIAVFSLDRGEIGYIFFRGKKGLAALSLLCQELADNATSAIRFSFDNVPVAGNEPFLPMTETVLNRLKDADVHSVQTDVITESGNLAPIPGVLLSGELQITVSECLQSVIGPIAKQVCTDVFKTTKTLRVAIEALAAELPDDDLAVQFKSDVRRAIEELDERKLTYCTNELPTAEIVASAKVGIVLTDDIKSLIREILPLFMGAKANSICTEVFNHTTTLRAAIDHITTHILTPLAAQQFKETVRSKLVKL